MLHYLPNNKLKNKAILVLNGDIVDKKIIKQLIIDNDVIIATDGSYDKLVNLNIVPNFVIGDFDSIKSIPQNVEIIKGENQNNSDFEKALLWLINNEYSDISIVGISGGRIDHLLINFALFYKYSNKLKIKIYTNNEILEILTPGKYSIYGKKNDLFSIIALPEAKNIVIKNAKYPINEKYFEIGSRGLSNEFLAEKINISFTSGLIVFIKSK